MLLALANQGPSTRIAVSAALAASTNKEKTAAAALRHGWQFQQHYMRAVDVSHRPSLYLTDATATSDNAAGAEMSNTRSMEQCFEHLQRLQNQAKSIQRFSKRQILSLMFGRKRLLLAVTQLDFNMVELTLDKIEADASSRQENLREHIQLLNM